MFGYGKGVKRCWGEGRRFFNCIQSVSELEIVFDAAGHGGIGPFYGFILSGVN